MPQANSAFPEEVTDKLTITSQPEHIYRVQGLPLDIDIKQATNLISAFFGEESDISMPQIRSFAQAHDSRARVATVCFQIIPVKLSEISKDEWSFDIENVLRTIQIGDENNEDGDNVRIRRKRMLTIDDHFRGFTVLSSPLPSDHEVEYVNVKIVGRGC